MKQREIDHYLTLPADVPCQYCEDRREHYKEPTEDCKQCGWLNRRELSYTVQIPVYKEEEL